MKRRINTHNIIHTDVYLFNKKYIHCLQIINLKQTVKLFFTWSFKSSIYTKKKVRRKRNTRYIKTKATSYNQKMNSDYVTIYNLIYTDFKLNDCKYPYIIQVYLLAYSYDPNYMYLHNVTLID